MKNHLAIPRQSIDSFLDWLTQNFMFIQHMIDLVWATHFFVDSFIESCIALLSASVTYKTIYS